MTGPVDGRRSIERWDTMLRALAAEPRRRLVIALADARADETLALPEAAHSSPPQRDQDLLHRQLVHLHLPTLAEADLIEWDREPLRARRGPRFAEVAALVDLLHEHAEELPSSLRRHCDLLTEQ
ncbi:hypothetical protein IL252_06605 [Halomicrobium sp. IBSBa]|uniref:hypothetical protein n=1 Tax=Halomicrobium sp. IBSBa TaxID=2778916 RepID=UPI001ABF4704|nr:hypothetical protein [Halomicrobium sp. IBSBa]MBO4247488.1 hypothetical protein [Halomicrobium sp. IBSBa]